MFFLLYRTIKQASKIEYSWFCRIKDYLCTDLKQWYNLNKSSNTASNLEDGIIRDQEGNMPSNISFNGSIQNNGNMDDKIVNTTGKEGNATMQEIPSPSDLYLPLVLLGVLSCLIIAANSLVIVLVYKKKQLQTITNEYLACLALSDLLSGLVAIPLIFACNLMAFADGIIACIAMDLASRFIAISTILHLVMVTFERYLMIIYPMHYHRIMSKKIMAATMVFIWSFSLTVSLIQLIWINFDPAQMETDERHIDAIYSYACVGFLVALPLILLAVFYIRIFLVLRSQLKKIRRQVSHIKSSRSARQKRGQKRAVTILGSMILAFILGWFSYFLSGILYDEDVEIHVPAAVNITLLFMRFGTSLINPLLYTLFKEDFKNVLKSYFFKNPQNCLDEIPLSSNAIS